MRSRTRCTNCDPRGLGQTYRPEWRECPKCMAEWETAQRKATTTGKLLIQAAAQWMGARESYCAHCGICSKCGTTGAEMEPFAQKRRSILMGWNLRLTGLATIAGAG